MKRARFPNGMTVSELKEAIKDWPEFREDGSPCEVWIGVGFLSNEARDLIPLNVRVDEKGTRTADLLLEYDA